MAGSPGRTVSFPPPDHADPPVPEGAHRGRCGRCGTFPATSSLSPPGERFPFCQPSRGASSEGEGGHRRAWRSGGPCPSHSPGRTATLQGAGGSPFDPSLRWPRARGRVLDAQEVPSNSSGAPLCGHRVRGEAWALYRLGFGSESGLPPAQVVLVSRAVCTTKPPPPGSQAQPSARRTPGRLRDCVPRAAVPTPAPACSCRLLPV